MFDLDSRHSFRYQGGFAYTATYTTYTTYTMHRTSALLLALGSPAAAWLKNSFFKSSAEESWTPPRETYVAEIDQFVAQGWTPRPTEAPKALFGRMELQPRLEGYTLGPNTCGFVASNASKY